MIFYSYRTTRVLLKIVNDCCDCSFIVLYRCKGGGRNGCVCGEPIFTTPLTSCARTLLAAPTVRPRTREAHASTPPPPRFHNRDDERPGIPLRIDALSCTTFRNSLVMFSWCKWHRNGSPVVAGRSGLGPGAPAPGPPEQPNPIQPNPAQPSPETSRAPVFRRGPAFRPFCASVWSCDASRIST